MIKKEQELVSEKGSINRMSTGYLTFLGFTSCLVHVLM